MNMIYDGFDVEVDVWATENGYFLGHDVPKYKVDYHFFINSHLWLHCKNEMAMVELSVNPKLNVFTNASGITLTSKGYLWTYPDLLLDRKSIAVLPEQFPDWDISKAFGVCTDYPIKYDNDWNRHA
jgi:hypothetical protein